MDFELEYDNGCDNDKLKIKGKGDTCFTCNSHQLKTIMVALHVRGPAFKVTLFTVILVHYFGGTLLFCQYGRGWCGKCHFKPCYMYM